MPMTRPIGHKGKKMTEQQKHVISDLLETKKQEILNYDMGEDWAIETIEAIEAMIEQLNK